MNFTVDDIVRFIAQTGHAAQIDLERHFPDHEKCQKILKNLEESGIISISHITRKAGKVDFSEDLYELTTEAKKALDDLAKDHS